MGTDGSHRLDHRALVGGKMSTIGALVLDSLGMPKSLSHPKALLVARAGASEPVRDLVAPLPSPVWYRFWKCDWIIGYE